MTKALTNWTDIPEGVEVWDSTKIKTVFDCQQKSAYKAEGWRGKGFAAAMLWGQAFHEVTEVFDHLVLWPSWLRGDDHAFEVYMSGVMLIVAKWKDELFDKLPEKDTKRKPEVFIRTAIGYWETWWGKEPFKTAKLGTVVGSELHWAFEYKGFWFTGYIDRVAMTETSRLYVVDRKTTGASLNENAALNYFAKYEMDLQMILYAEAISRVYGKEVDGVMIDAIQPLVKESRFKKFPMRFTQSARLEALDQIVTRLKAYTFNREHSVPYEMNYQACDGMFSCAFKKVCRKLPAARVVTLEAEFDKPERWNPREPRESVISKLGGWDAIRALAEQSGETRAEVNEG